MPQKYKKFSRKASRLVFPWNCYTNSSKVFLNFKHIFFRTRRLPLKNQINYWILWGYHWALDPLYCISPQWRLGSSHTSWKLSLVRKIYHRTLYHSELNWKGVLYKANEGIRRCKLFKFQKGGDVSKSLIMIKYSRGYSHP